jgi:NAD(P)-dependent dehydrogenase (short-subunit alcohol dehydrogenase family)
MTDALIGKNVIVTGASRGLGSQIAQAVWRNGANILLVARSTEALLALRTHLVATASGGQQAHVVVADLCAPESVPTIMREARRVWDKIDVLVNNAAVLGPIGRAWENDWEEWQMTLRVNLLAPVELCRSCVLWMRECGQGKIINLSGGGAAGPRANFSAYATAKVGLVRFSEILAHEVRESAIAVNCVAPGTLQTEMLHEVVRAGPEKAGAVEYAQAVKQLEQTAFPQQAAELCVFLASAASDGITGKLLSAVWDPWERLPDHLDDLRDSDLYTLRRITPRERGKDWG